MPYFLPHAMCKHGWEGGPALECSRARRSWAESSRQTPAHGGQSTKTQQQRQARCDQNLGREGQAGHRQCARPPTHLVWMQNHAGWGKISPWRRLHCARDQLPAYVTLLSIAQMMGCLPSSFTRKHIPEQCHLEDHKDL